MESSIKVFSSRRRIVTSEPPGCHQKGAKDDKAIMNVQEQSGLSTVQSKRFQTPISISSSQASREAVHFREKESQIKISKRKQNEFKVKLQGDKRCEVCIDSKRETCIIRIGRNNEVVATCEYCRRKSHAVATCKPNVEALEAHFPNHNQIESTKERLLKAMIKTSIVQKNVLQIEQQSSNSLKSSKQFPGMKCLSSNSTSSTKEGNKSDDKIAEARSRLKRTISQDSEFEIVKVKKVENNKSNMSTESKKAAKETKMMMNLDEIKKKNPSLIDRLGDVDKMLKFKGDAESKVGLAQILVDGILRDLTNR